MNDKDLKIKFFGLHLGQRVKGQFNEGLLTGIYYSMEWEKHFALILYKGSTGSEEINKCHLILKLLSQISDEDCAYIAMLVMNTEIGLAELMKTIKNSSDEWVKANPIFSIKKEIYDTSDGIDYWVITISLTDDTYFSFYPEDMTMVYRYLGDTMPVSNTVHINDYLRSKGYLLPFQGLDPVAEGWAVLEEKTIEK